jgi:hypothetical protein
MIAGSAGFPAGSPPTRLDAASAASGSARRRSPSGVVWAVAGFLRRQSRAGGIEPPPREGGWKAGAPSPCRRAVQAGFVGILDDDYDNDNERGPSRHFHRAAPECPLST